MGKRKSPCCGAEIKTIKHPLGQVEHCSKCAETIDTERQVMLERLDAALGDNELWLVPKWLDKRIRNQLRIHWYWLKDRGHEEVARFIMAIILKSRMAKVEYSLEDIIKAYEETGTLLIKKEK